MTSTRRHTAGGENLASLVRPHPVVAEDRNENLQWNGAANEPDIACRTATELVLRKSRNDSF